MIAMQYSFVFPADYDMSIIEDRVAKNGHVFDDFPDMRFKVFQIAVRDGDGTDNIYAPFYLWDDIKGMNTFLAGDKFVGLTRSFGWPSVKAWNVLGHSIKENASEATYTQRSVAPIASHADMTVVTDTLLARLDELSAMPGVLGAAVGFEPTSWTSVEFSLWSDAEPDRSGQPGTQVYKALHVADPHKAAATGRAL